ncbi:hypothetical protein SLEP1_g55653 [Rubroshorea leprosula]|uniref:Uncharacterized protein n=1 Tax=Rubroshorea leprosula TaxID=152421 RepID=A0AAV5MFZ2_9ROSI|nr:hypothetical protein SLEP1_g55653 [Rubroshorea leprosula]
MADDANLGRGALENHVENMESTLKELMASFQSLQATLVTRAPLTTNSLFEGNVSMANLPIATSTLGKEPMSSCPPNPTIGGTSGIKPFDLNAGVATAQSNDQEKTQVDKSITEDEDKAIKAKLIATRLVTPVPMVPLNPPFPIWYNPQARCEYHSGGVGHDLENCLVLKHRVQDMIDAKELQITSEPEVVVSNITKNPLPTHDGPIVNMIKKDSDKGHEVTTSTNNDGLSTSFEKLSICVIDEGKGDDKLILPTHGEALDNKLVEILPVLIIKS